ncbi:MAG: UTRA domain-containing protein [Oceanospirillaceae bacterium]
MSEAPPVYLQLRGQLLAWIKGKQLSSQDKLPAERELAVNFNTTRITLRQALAQLEAEGVIYRSNRRGWFITPERLEYDPSRDVGFNVYVASQGFTPRTETIVKSLITAPAWLAKKCNLVEGAPIYHFVRRRYVDERALLIEHNFINATSCSGLLAKDTDNSLWKLLESEYQLRPKKRKIEIYPQAIIADEAQWLNVNTGSAGLYLERISYAQAGQFLEFDQEYWLHDALKLVVNVEE